MWWKRSGVLAAAILLAVGVSTATGPSQARAAGDPVQEFVAQLNAVRHGVGAGPVVLMPSLTADAQAWSSAMAAGACGTDRLCHRTDLVAVANRQAGTAWSVAGENVASMLGTDDAAVSDVIRRFEASPAHQANDENPVFNEVGVAFATSPDGLIYLTVEFVGADVAPQAPPDQTHQPDLPARPIPPRGVVVARSPFHIS